MAHALNDMYKDAIHNLPFAIFNRQKRHVDIMILFLFICISVFKGKEHDEEDATIMSLNLI